MAELRRRPADLVLASQTHVNVLLALLRPLLPPRTRLVLREPTLRPSAGARDRAIGWLLGRADLLVASSPAMVSRLRATAGGRTPIVLLPNPVDVRGLREAVRHGTASPSGAFEDDGSEDALRLVVVGRLTPGKGHDDLLEAIAGDDGAVRLTVLGDGPLSEALAQHARRLGLIEGVRFIGRVDDPVELASIVASADLLVQPSRFEGMPNAVLESLAVGTPVLATTELVVLAELAEEVGPAGLRLVPRDGLTAALATLARPTGPLPRPSLLPERFAVDAVVSALLDEVGSLGTSARGRDGA